MDRVKLEINMRNKEKQLLQIQRLCVLAGLGIIILCAQSLLTGQNLFLTYAGTFATFFLGWVTLLIAKVVKEGDQ